MVLQERCNQTCFSVQPKIIFRSSWGLVTPRTPDKTPLLPAESHRRCPIPLRTASKACLWPHFINHTILSVTPLHASRSMHNPLASSKPISLSAHALLTPSLHLKGGLPLPLCPSTSDIYTLLVILSLPIRSTYQNHFNTFRSTLPLNGTLNFRCGVPSLQSVAIVTGGVEGWACEVPSLQPMGDLGDLAPPQPKPPPPP